VAVAADLSKYLDKAYENKTLEEILTARSAAAAAGLFVVQVVREANRTSLVPAADKLAGGYG